MSGGVRPVSGRDLVGAGTRRRIALVAPSTRRRRGEYVAIKGRSGSGKTTLNPHRRLRTARRPGGIVVGDAEVTAMSDDDPVAAAAATVSMSSSPSGSSRSLTARGENVSVPLRLNKVEPRERDERSPPC